MSETAYVFDLVNKVVYPLNRCVVVGRKKGDLLYKEDKRVSASHCQILSSEGKFSVTDLNSSNKTRVNGEVLVPGKPFLLSQNDVIELGEQKLLFSLTKELGEIKFKGGRVKDEFKEEDVGGLEEISGDTNSQMGELIEKAKDEADKVSDVSMQVGEELAEDTKEGSLDVANEDEEDEYEEVYEEDESKVFVIPIINKEIDWNQLDKRQKIIIFIAGLVLIFILLEIFFPVGK